MSIHYVCRICYSSIGRINQEAVSEAALGLGILNNEERQAMISRDASGNITVKITCEHCQEAALRHPDLTIDEHIIQ